MALRADDVDLRRDRVLVERYQAGDTAAFDDLYRRYFDRLSRYCARRVSDADTAEEIAQEAFARALDALPRLRGDRRFYPWMTVIASRLCVDHHRRTWRLEAADGVEVASPWSQHDDLDHEVDLANLGTALARLAPRHREVLELREREELSYVEIAERLDVSHSTVEALLHRARRALRREFQAVSGESAGRLAAIPGLGWLIDRVVRLRAGEAGSLTKPLLATAASLAMIAAPMGMVHHEPLELPAPSVAEAAAAPAGAASGRSGIADAATGVANDLGASPARRLAGAAPRPEAADPGHGRRTLISVHDGKVQVNPDKGQREERDSGVVAAALPTVDADISGALRVVSEVGRTLTDAMGRSQAAPVPTGVLP